ncbi:MAG TPA: M23 family peptidase, partial [Burkholderiales bacterium]|nr:M23 family peptidase [Burkholderiales bacterium]
MTLTHRHMFGGAVLIGVLVLALTLGLFWITVRHASELKVQLPLLDSLVKSAQEAQQRKTEEFLRENLNAMAVKLGEMQAQLMRLDALGERLSALAGLKPGEFRFTEVPGRGGAVSSAKDLSMAEFNRQLDQLGRQMENRTDSLGVLESQLF